MTIYLIPVVECPLEYFSPGIVRFGAIGDHALHFKSQVHYVTVMVADPVIPR